MTSTQNSVHSHGQYLPAVLSLDSKILRPIRADRDSGQVQKGESECVFSNKGTLTFSLAINELCTPASVVRLVHDSSNSNPVDHVQICRLCNTHPSCTKAPNDAAQTRVLVLVVYTQNPKAMHVMIAASRVQGLTINPPSLPFEVVVVFEPLLDALLDAPPLLEVVVVPFVEVVPSCELDFCGKDRML